MLPIEDRTVGLIVLDVRWMENKDMRYDTTWIMSRKKYNAIGIAGGYRKYEAPITHTR